MGKLSTEQQQTWDSLKGFDDEIQFYFKRKGNFYKYNRIQGRLRLPKVTIQPVRGKRTGPGFEKAKWQNGVEELAKYMTQRKVTIPKAMDTIQQAFTDEGFGKIKWGKMSVIYKYVYTRYQNDIVLGADVLIKGKTGDGVTVDYYYDNSNSAEGAHRYAIVNGKKVGVYDKDIIRELRKVNKNA
jgi:hypothetical protein